MPTVPTISFIAGSGLPRLVRVFARPSGNIVSSSVANPTVLRFTGKHRLTSGMTVRIAGHTGSTPAVDGDRVVTVIDAYSISVPVNVTAAGTGGSYEALTQVYESSGTTTFTATTANETGSPTFAPVKTNHRILSYRVVSGLSFPTWGKVVSKTTGVITIDGWTNGTPTGGQKFIIDGWISDLPRCQEMTESFDPDHLLHNIYQGDQGSALKSKFRGYKYECMLDYSKYAGADLLIDLSKIFNQAPEDEIILIPRRDVPGFNYNVILGAPFSITRHRNEGYKKPVFVFKGKENIQCYGVRDGYGYNYAGNYGTNY